MTTVDSVLSKLVGLAHRHTTERSAERRFDSGIAGASDEHIARAVLYPPRSVHAQPKEGPDEFHKEPRQ